MTMIREVFFDIDGLLANWHKQICKTFNYDHIKILENWSPLGSYELSEQLGMKQGEMWKVVNNIKDWWATIEPYDYAHDLVKMFKGYKIRILTSPAMHESCFEGKAIFIKKHFPSLLADLIICKDKYLLAAWDRLLIDDSDKKLNPWIAAGGHGILWPQPWNSNYEHRFRQMDYLQERLDAGIT